MPVCSFWYFCTYAPRLDVSLIKKIPRPSNLRTTYMSQYSRWWFSQKKYFPTRSILFRIYKLHLYFSKKKSCIYKFITSGMNFFSANPIAKNTATGRSCANLKVGWFFCKRDIQPRDIFMHFNFVLKKTCIWKFVNSEKNTSGLNFSFLPIPSPRIPRQVGRVQIWRSWYFLKARYPAAGHKFKSTTELFACEKISDLTGCSENRRCHTVTSRGTTQLAGPLLAI